MTLNQKVKAACALREISVAELGRRIGLSQSNFFQRLQKGKFTQEELEKIAEALECKYVSYFEFEDGTKI
nr:MAG TPA: Cro/C1-type HTH DNA-binding domain protein [Caudoviricetes sp.]